MSHRTSLKSCALATTSVAVIGAAMSVGAVAPAFAQEAAQDRVVVTGSRIQRQDFTANSPIVTVDAATFENTSTIGIETVLNQLPQFLPAVFTQFNSTNVEPNPFQTPGASNVNLRGLGPNRTLTLVNGRRAVPLNALMVVDTNSIPSSAIQRVEIISGGASAVYGADALAGVVNLILKEDFEGLTVDTQYGVTELGDNREFRISGLFGANLANGRGNVMLGVEHSTRGFASWNDRDWYRDQMNATDVVSFAAGTEFWFSETYWAPNGFGSVHGGPQASQAAIDSLFPAAPPGAITGSANFFVNPTTAGDGTVFTGGTLFSVIAAPGATDFFGHAPDGGYKYSGPTVHPEFVGGPTWRKQTPHGQWVENQMLNYVSTPLQRYSMFGSANYEVADNIEAFASVTFARTQTKTLLQYSPANNAWGVDIPHGTGIYADSVDGFGNTLPAYLPGGAFGLNCPAVGGCTDSQVFPVSPELALLLDSRGVTTFGPGGPTFNTIDPDGVPYANYDWHLNRNMDYLPPRQTVNRSTNFQITAGLEGTLANDWFWDVSMSHGQAESLVQSVGFASLGAYRLIATSPNYGRSGFWQENPGHGVFAAGGSACTTGLPLMEEFAVSEDCVTALSRNMQETSLMEQSVVEANITGDLFELPSGPLQFALGAAYRENNYEFRTDPMKSITGITDQAIGIFPAGSTTGQLDVGEIYGELLIPILRDLPLIQHFDLELGGRYSDYSEVGGVKTFKILGDWGINEYARVRGGYNRASRAANIGELYQSRTTTAFGGAGAQGDPCTPNNTASPVTVSAAANEGGAAGAAHARAICEALMGVAGAAAYYANPPALAGFPPGVAGNTGQTAFVGNPNLDPETAHTWTAGVVLNSPLSSPALSGLRLTVDYFQIKIADYIGQNPVDDVYYECLSQTVNATVAEALANPACNAIQREQSSGIAVFTESNYINTGGIKLAGVDVQLDWSAQLEDLGLGLPGGVALNVLATFPTEVRADFGANAGINYVGYTASPIAGVSGSQYDYRVFTTFNYFTGPWSASLRWQHYPTIDADPNNLATIGVHTAYNVFALSGSYRLNDTFTLRAGVENILDQKPPLSGGNPAGAVFPIPALRGGGAGGGIYDTLGRRFFAGASASF